MSNNSKSGKVVSVVRSILDESNLETVKRSAGSLTVGEIASLMRSGHWVTDAAYQRSEKSGWYTESHCDSVFDSLFRGVGFGALTVNTSGESYSVIDGGHRSRFLARALGGDVTWRGLSIVDNPDLLAALRALPIDVVEYDSLDDSACGAIFEALNDGVSLSAIEKRRGRIQWLTLNPEFSGAVKLLRSIMPEVAKKAARKEAAEEILLQAISGRLGNRDYTGKSVVDYLAARQAEVIAQIAPVVDNVAALVEYVQADKEVVKRSLKKSWLNVFLAVDKLNLNNLSSFCAQFANDVEKPAQAKEFSDAASSSSASTSAVSARYAIALSVNSGMVERGKLKIKAGKSEAGKSEADSAEADSLELAFYNTFGRGTFEPEEVSKVLDFCAKGWDSVIFRVGNKSGRVVNYADCSPVGGGKVQNIPIDKML